MVFSTIDVTGPLFGAVADLGAKQLPIADPWSDQQTPSPICGANLGMTSTAAPSVISMGQGSEFTRLFPAQRGGKMTHRRTTHLSKHRKNQRMTHRKNLKQRGGSAPFPDAFDNRLPADLVDASRTGSLDKAMADLPQFAGSYGLQQGGRRKNNRRSSRKASRKASRKNRKASRKNRKASRKNRKASRKASMKRNRKNRRQEGGAYGDDAMSVPESSKLLLSPEMERFAYVNPQFYNENIVNPNFQAPYSAYIQSQVAAQH